MQIFPAVYAIRVLGTYAGMTSATVHRIEPALVLAIVGADVAVEAIRLAVRARREVIQIDLVALAAGVVILGVD